MSILEVAEGSRVMLLEHMKVQYGQFFTPASLAERVVCGLRLPGAGALRMLDLGAGAGALTAAVARLLPEGMNLQVTCVEVDADLLPHLGRTLAGLDHEIIHGDALSLAARGMLREDHDVVVMNPPYGKLAASSEERRAMAQLGVDVPNIYAAFMAIGYLHLRRGGRWPPSCRVPGRTVPISNGSGSTCSPTSAWTGFRPSPPGPPCSRRPRCCRRT